MKKILFIAAILLSTLGLKAQKDTTFYRHEVRISCGEALTSSLFWFHEGEIGGIDELCLVNVSVAYFYRPVKWFWVGGNLITYCGGRLHYNWREYYSNGSYRDFEKSKMKLAAVIAPEIRFSYLNKNMAILYSALSVGVGWEDGFDNQWHTYPRVLSCFHITYFGFSFNFGENKNGFIGGELGVGHKGIVSMHLGYRF